MGGRSTACRESVKALKKDGENVTYLPSDGTHHVYVVEGRLLWCTTSMDGGCWSADRIPA